MLRLFLKLSYNGTKYHGWQKQVDVPSIQGSIENCLFRLTNRHIHCHGCGRTDKGVHALKFYAHVDVMESESFRLLKLAKLLPEDIKLLDIIEVRKESNAQFDAISRTYTYLLHFIKSPFLEEYSALYNKAIYDLEKMEKAFYLIGTVDDFEFFCKTPNAYKNTFCKVEKLVFSRIKDGVELQFTSDRFLRSMIRYLVASILDVSAGKISLEDWQAILEKKKPLPYRKEAFPHGLYLSDVKYPFL